MIDPEAAAEAWERYRRGEPNAFSHRIYIGRGAQTAEEVRRRYRLNPEFHATVDRYVQEFERLLAELNRDNADQSVLRNYLISETGLVYTMLAHASGRLG
jgi:DNA-binding GntR family transcriptional regulator